MITLEILCARPSQEALTQNMKGLLTCSRAIENKGLFVEPKAPNPEAVKVSGGKKKLVRNLSLEIGSPVYGLLGPETVPLERKTKNQKRRMTNRPLCE